MRRFLLSLCFLSLGCPGGLCGDDALDEGEACDDGNTTNADGCEANCSLPACQNGIVDPGELCLFDTVSFGVDEAPQELIAEDLNGDGLVDLAVATSSFSISVLLGDGLGGFSRLPEVELDAVGRSLVVGDFDGDGTQDLAASLIDLNRVQVFQGLGDGSFSELAPLTTSPFPLLLLTNDFNNDSILDLITGHFAEPNLNLFLGAGDGSFLPLRATPTNSGVSGITAGDFNNDGNQDLAASLGEQKDSLLVLLGDGAGNLTPQPLQAPGQVPGDILAADLDGNGVLDLVAGRAAGEIGVFTGQGSALFSETQTRVVRFPLGLAVGDVNADGRLDIAVGSGLDQANNAHLSLLVGEGAGSFSAQPLLFPLGFAGPRGLALADVNDDGALDAALSDEGNSRLLVFFSQP